MISLQAKRCAVTSTSEAAQVTAKRFHKAKRLKELSFGFAAPMSDSESGELSIINCQL
jgi:hypothetical protein